jgi:cellulose synthase/poly-beta-1,6-N-acetylglucosamine synthase-like glycosyltransferase
MTGMMEFLFWLILALIAYTYVGYPLLLVLLSRVINRPIRRDPEYRPTVTILVCALNEGSMFAIRKSIYQPMPDPAVADDYYLSAFIRHRGFRLVYEPLARSFEDVAPTSSDEYRRKVRIIQGGLRGFWLMRHLCNPMKTGVYSIQIFTRQFLRRAVALLFPLLLLLNLLIVLRQPSLFYGALLLGQLGILFLALAGWRIVSDKGRAPFLIYAPYYFAMVNLASVHGMWN